MGITCQGPSTADGLSQQRGVHTVEYYEAVKRDRLCIRWTTGMPRPGNVLTAEPIGRSSEAAPEAK